MSGLLNNKTRVLDTILTDEGKEQLSRGFLDVSYYSFTDGGTFYEYDLISGSTDATSRVFFEVWSSPWDAITPLSDDTGVIQSFETSVGKFNKGTILDTGGDPYSSSIDLGVSIIHTASIDSLIKQQIISTFDPLFEVGTFSATPTDISANSPLPFTCSFTITDQYPLSGEYKTLNINSLPSVFYDPHLIGSENLMYLPPVIVGSDGKVSDLNPGLYHSYPYYDDFLDSNPEKSFDYFVGPSVRVAQQSGNEKIINFNPTSVNNNLLCQLFEVTSNGKGVATSINKLFLIDGGEQQVEGKQAASRIFYAGKLLDDDNGNKTFVRIFTLLFE